jgi:hypothetical protein
MVSAATAPADEPKVSAEFNRAETRVGDPVSLTVTVEGGSVEGEPEVRPGNDYHVLFQGQSRNFTFVNGEFSSSTTYTFRVIPRKEGTIAVGPIDVRVDGKTYEVSPLNLTVRSDTDEPPQQPAPPREDRGGDPADDGGLFITTDVNRDTIYVNQQTTLTFRFYQGLQTSVLSQPSYTPPSTTGFLKEELGDQKQFTVRRTGRVYKVTEIQTALFPTRTGRLQIGGAEVECIVQDRSRRSHDPFSVFRSGIFGERKVKLRSKPLEVQVLPLPSRGRPADFDGAVGSFSLSVKADTATVRTNEPVTIRATISGPGSVTTLGSLELPAPEGVRLFDSGQEVSTRVKGGEVQAEKVITWILVPTSPRPLQIPSLQLAYFDPKAGRYRRTVSDPLTVQVLPGDAPDLVTSGGVPTSLVGRDIRYLKTDFDGLRWGKTAGPLGPVPWIHGLPLAILVAALIVHGRRRRLESDAVALRRSSAQRRARARLRSQGEDDRPERVAEILEAYLADRIGDPAMGATRAQLLDQVSHHGIAADLLEETRSFLEECDARAFTPGGAVPGGDSLTESASALVDRLEEGFRRS